MSLLDDYSEAYKFMNKIRTADGEGGYITTWSEGAEVKMPMRHDTSIQAVQAEAQGVKSTFKFYPPKDSDIEFHDVLKRVSDGAIFRITSNAGDTVTPISSSLNRTMVTAERWELPS